VYYQNKIAIIKIQGQLRKNLIYWVMLNYCNIFGQQSQWHHMTSSHNILLPPDRVECQCDSNQVVFEKQNVNKVPSFEVIKIKCAIEKGIIFIDHQFTKIEIPKITFVKCKVWKFQFQEQEKPRVNTPIFLEPKPAQF